MRFEFATAGRIIFGRGTVREVQALVKPLGKRALLVTGQGGADPDLIRSLLQEAGIVTSMFLVDQEPTIDLVQSGTEQARLEQVDLVIGFGGGSVIDAGKAISILFTNPGNLLDYLEVIGSGLSLKNPPLPYIAVPTTAGTGAEVTRNAVIASPEHKVKVSLRSPLMLPRIAIVDPELTYSVPADITASTGMDALVQVIEPFVSIRANPVVDSFCRQGMHAASTALREAYFHGDDVSAREAMAFTSLMGGLSLANAGLGVVHGFASVIGGMFSAPHGVICARIMGPAMKVNLHALEERAPGHPASGRYQEAARIITHNIEATPEDGMIWMDELCADLNIPRLSGYGVSEQSLDDVVEKTAVASSTQANPIKLTLDELRTILVESL